MNTVGGDLAGTSTSVQIGVFVEKQQLKAEATAVQLLQSAPTNPAAAAPAVIQGLGGNVDRRV